MAGYDLKDYKEVSERIIDLRQKYPDASLQAEVILWPTEALPFIAVKALCFRTRKDENPGVGLAWEPFPGKTNYTRDSELQNAETSAWGRAIVAALASDTKQGVASKDEIRNRRAPEPSSLAGAGSGTEAGPDRTSGPASQPSIGDPTTRGGAPVESEGTGGEPVGEGGEPSVSLDAAVKAYGGQAHLLRAAREQWDVRSVKDITDVMLAELLRVEAS